MKVISSYKVKILHYNHIFDETVSVYRKAVASGILWVSCT